MNKPIILSCLVAAMLLQASVLQAREPRHLFWDAYNELPDKASVIKPGGEWFPYPAYEDREGWEKLTKFSKKNYIAAGEKALKKDWPMTLASQYIETEKTGTRKYTRGVDNSARAMLATLTLAELAEGKGRFIPKLIDGLYWYAEKATWSYHVHTKSQPSRRGVPDPQYRVISLGSAHTGQTIAVAWHFFHKEFDKYDPSISKTILRSLDRNIFEPFLNPAKEKYQSWLGFNGNRVNNWNTYCNTFVLSAFLLCEQDPDRLLKGVERSLRSVDNYLNSVNLDGACDEGPSYWSMAGGKVYDYTRMLCDATGGAINLFGDDQIRRLCEYIAKIYIGDGWVINFGDGGPRTAGDALLTWRMGEDLDSQELRDYAIAASAKPATKSFSAPRPSSAGEMYRTLEALRYAPGFVVAQRAALADADGDMDKMLSDIRKKATSEWYPDTQVAVLRTRTGWFLGAKGGHNAESHNHNDVGSCVFFIDACPVFVDPGNLDYGKYTFSSRRYEIWCNRSDWHNTPSINGTVQHAGRDFAAQHCQCDTDAGTFSLDLCKVYDKDAQCNGWTRTYALSDKQFTITDQFDLQARKAADVLNFSTPGTVYLPGQKAGRYKVKKGEVVIDVRSFDGNHEFKVKISYPKDLLTASVVANDFKDLEGKLDDKMAKRWSNSLSGIRFTSSDNAPLQGSYSLNITLMK
ncbi:MAG: heparinase II/III family protein [Bacteroidales bacterium]|nr:heparinase II/III family protein [Bacteroidales bacterium]